MINALQAVSLFGLTVDLNADSVLLGLFISQALLAIINIFAVAIVLTRVSVARAIDRNAKGLVRKSVIEAEEGEEVLLTAAAPQNVAAESVAWFVNGEKMAIGYSYRFRAPQGAYEVIANAGDDMLSETSVLVRGKPAAAPVVPVAAPEPAPEPVVEEAAPAEAEEAPAAPEETPAVEEAPAPVEELQEEPAPVPAPVAAEEEAAAELDEESFQGKLRYDLSFTARIIRSKDEIKLWYSSLKNELLSYAKVKDRMSWKRETFKYGRDILARLSFRGKTLCLSLPLLATEFEGSKFELEDVSDQSSNADTPSLYRIRSEKRMRYAKELIAYIAGVLAAEKTEREDVDYYMPYQGIVELIDAGLAKRTVTEVTEFYRTEIAGEAAPAEGTEAPAETTEAPAEPPVETPAEAPIETSEAPAEAPVEAPEEAPAEGTEAPKA